GNAGFDQLITNDTAQVQKRLAGLAVARLARGAWNFLHESRGEFGVNFKAAWPYRRTERDPYCAGRVAELFHSMQAVDGNSRRHSTAARMQRACYLGSAADHQNRDAIGGKDSENYPRLARRHPVGARTRFRIRMAHDPHRITVDLVHARKDDAVGKCAAQPLPVVRHGLRIVAHEVREVERLVSTPASSSKTSEKSMYDAGFRPRT